MRPLDRKANMVEGTYSAPGHGHRHPKPKTCASSPLRIQLSSASRGRQYASLGGWALVRLRWACLPLQLAMCFDEPQHSTEAIMRVHGLEQPAHVHADGVDGYT